MSIRIGNDENYRFNRSEEYQEKMQRLRVLGIFDAYPIVMTASAIVGFNNDLFVPITKRASDGVQWSFFTEQDKQIIDLIAYARTNDQTILKSKEKFAIFESYSNGGFPYLYEKLGVNDETTRDQRKEILMRYYNLIEEENGFKV